MACPSLQGFMDCLKMRVRMAVKGERIINKARLCIWVVLESIPRTVMRALPFLKFPVEIIETSLTRKITVNISGSKFRCVDSESIYILSPEFESWMSNYLNIDNGDVFVDVGAHIGKYTIPIAKIVGENGLVIAVEAHSDNYKTLAENVKLNSLRNVIALNMAAWSEECKLKLFIGDMHGHHSVKKDYGLGFVTVQAKALDDVFDRLRLGRVDYIKIDVEGAELEVLKGLVKTLKKHRPIVIVEVWKDPAKVKKFVGRKGYNMRQIADEYYILEPRRAQTCR